MTERPTHIDEGGEARMVDVGDKPVTVRRAVARARVAMSPATREAARAGAGPKGEVEAVARVAGIQAAKRTQELIPLCHGLSLTSVNVDLAWTDEGAEITATAECRDRTGVEMEAMTAAAVSALTLYDMVKGIERGVTITEVALVEKSGGRTGPWRREG